MDLKLISCECSKQVVPPLSGQGGEKKTLFFFFFFSGCFHGGRERKIIGTVETCDKLGCVGMGELLQAKKTVSIEVPADEEVSEVASGNKTRSLWDPAQCAVM
jgi:hypothetical protein